MMSSHLHKGGRGPCRHLEKISNRIASRAECRNLNYVFADAGPLSVFSVIYFILKICSSLWIKRKNIFTMQNYSVVYLYLCY